MTALHARAFQSGDTPALTAILNTIIAAGGTTGYEVPFTPEALRLRHFDGAGVLCCHSAVLDDLPVGFQSLTAKPSLPPGWGVIATFTRRDPPVKGAGRALFAATQARAKVLGLTHLHATIRADNVPGLAYYAAIGFVDQAVIAGPPMRDGRRIDRVIRHFAL